MNHSPVEDRVDGEIASPVAVVIRRHRNIAQDRPTELCREGTRGDRDEPLTRRSANDGEIGLTIAVVISRDRHVTEGRGPERYTELLPIR